jgi:type I restriction enzyme R subunit
MARDSKEILEVEDPIIEVLTEHLGYNEILPKEAEKERESIKDIILKHTLSKKLKELNPWISKENINRVIQKIENPQSTTTLEANELIQGILEKGTTVRQDNKSLDVTIIDYENPENNEFTVSRQFRIKHHKENIPDVVLFVNGIPTVVIECKSPTKTNPMDEAQEQLFRYQEQEDRFRKLGCPKLFNTTQIIVGTYKDKIKYATNLTPKRYWSEWKEPFPKTFEELTKTLPRTPSPQDIFLFGVCEKNNLLNLIQNFIVYEKEKGKVVKKIARYQQYRAVNKLVTKLTKKKTSKGGVIWHTQGSGKSLSMLWSAVKLRRETKFENPTIIIITDRTDLDDQISGTFTRCGFANPIQTKSAKHLQELLSNPVGQTIMTTIQKFQDSADMYPTLTKKENIFVLIDEAHRTQYKSLGANLRKGLPNATFIGFTGTPISKKNRSTLDTFGSYVDIYDHRQAENDGATVPIYYESRMPNLSITGKSLDALFDRLFKEYSKEQKEKIKKKYANRDAIAISKDRIREICLDILEHYEKYIEPNGFKAQIVTFNRLAAIRYKEILDELNAPSSEVLISPQHNDEEHFEKYHKNKAQEKATIEKFKKDKDPQIIVVCDKLLTGFDAPIEQVMYLDSPLKEHTLLQAIARVNRTYEGKQFGLVIDYWGVSQDLQEALNMFSKDESEGMVHTDYKKEVLPRLESAHNVVMNFFNGINVNNVEDCVMYLEPEDRRVTFNQRFRTFSNYLDMLYPDPKALKFIKDLRKLAEIKIKAKNKFEREKETFKECSAKVLSLIDEHIKVEGIDKLIEPTSIFSKKFDEEVDKLGSAESKASEIEHAVKHEINLKLDEDPIFYESLNDKLKQIIEDYKEGRINALEQLKLVKEVLNEMRNPKDEAKSLGIDPLVSPFYKILSTNKSNNKDIVREDVAQYGNKKKLSEKEAATEIYKVLEKYTTIVDWHIKDDIKRQIRSRLKRILRQTDCDKIENKVVEILDIAKARFSK